ncbi:hypothetical protein MPH_02591 [Macrophomina phaseolina MS6]|uniref:Uncharacterized protein n=1 Tax=Macrophomina phaseolina (strain MS6) TaxID=1126212 RepID=K2S541_MACPH|nr:hypothetical protein MPH_02591 [Macrophomina phaseolina MS6]
MPPGSRRPTQACVRLLRIRVDRTFGQEDGASFAFSPNFAAVVFARLSTSPPCAFFSQSFLHRMTIHADLQVACQGRLAQSHCCVSYRARQRHLKYLLLERIHLGRSIEPRLENKANCWLAWHH